jgi:23S rRNA (cytidine2498-2'-O)-methyltransferase
MRSDFVFAVCQRGAEPALKRELSRTLGLAPAYQRPGLVTFRAPHAVDESVLLRSVFARAWGVSLGTVPDLEAASRRIRELPAPLCLHVFERDLHRPDEEPKGFVRGAYAGEVERQLRSAKLASLAAGSLAREGELVLDVAVAPGDPWLLGLHRHVHGRSPHPGGRYPVTMPDDAPSRAFAKIEEAIQAFDLPVRAGDVALEIGAAPGGAAHALLRRGVHVIGVDPGDLAPQVLSYVGPGGARVTHLPIPVAALTREQLPARVDWLLLDVHLAPQVALRAVRRIVPMVRRSLRGVVLTLKLNDWAFAERIDSFVAQVRELGIPEPLARQLPSHRQEIAIAGQTAR